MLPTPTLLCLFCHHLNPAGASYCSDCGSQLNLQPCDRCYAINKRSAVSCHKCNAIFKLPAFHGFESSNLDDSNKIPAYQVLNDLDGPSDQGSRPSPARRDLHMLRHGLRPGELNPMARGGVTAGKGAIPNRFRVFSHTEQQAEDTAVSERSLATARLRHKWRIAVYLLLLAAMTSFVYYYSGPTGQRTQKQPVDQTAASVSGEPNFSVSSSPVVEVQVQSAPVQPAHSVQAATPRKAASSISEFDDDVLLARSGTGAAIKQRPTPAIDTKVPPQTSRAFGECPEAVATLGLCSSIPQQERP